MTNASHVSGSRRSYFYRDGERVRTLLEQAQAQAQDMRAALALLGVTEESEVQP